jgi:plasmid maintenance system antidote protein VapI
MDYKKREEFARLHIQVRQATDSLHTQAEEVYEIAKELESLTKDTTIRYATLRVRVEARAAFEQVNDLRRALEEMGKEMRGEAP